MKTVLSLQSQLDSDGSGGSENRRFFDSVLDAKKSISEGPFVIFCGFRRPKGAHGILKWLPK